MPTYKTIEDGRGSEVVQRVLEHCLPAQTKGILEELVQNLLSLFRDQSRSASSSFEEKRDFLGLFAAKIERISAF